MKSVYILANLIMAVVAGVAYLRMPPVVPLWYSLGSTSATLAPWYMIGVIPLLMNVCLITNHFLTRHYKEHTFVAPTLRVANVVVAVSFTLIFLKILSLVVL